MVKIRQKTQIEMKLSATAETHARSRVKVRDVVDLIDEPEERGGTNQGPSPTETLMSSLIGCTNVITQKIAHKRGVEISAMDIRFSAKFDRRGVLGEEEIDVPFPEITLTVKCETSASQEDLNRVGVETSKYCAIAKLFSQAGTDLTVNWVKTT